MRNLVSPQATAAAPLVPGTGSPGATIVAPAPLAPPPSPPMAQASPLVPAGHVALAVAARYGRDAPPISGGLIWRVYAAKPDATGVFRLIKEDRAAAPTFVLPPGSYVVHASLGLASAAKAVQLRAETVREMFDIPGRRHAARGPRRRRAHSDRTDIVRDLSPAASSIPQSAGRSRRT